MRQNRVHVVLQTLNFGSIHIFSDSTTVPIQTTQTNSVEVYNSDTFYSGSCQHVYHMRSNSTYSKHQNIRIFHFLEFLLSKILDNSCQLLLLDMLILFRLGIDCFNTNRLRLFVIYLCKPVYSRCKSSSTQKAGNMAFVHYKVLFLLSTSKDLIYTYNLHRKWNYLISVFRQIQYSYQNQSMELDDIQIQVGSPQQRSEIGGVNKYFVYALKGKDSKGQIAVLRRYSDFNLLREILVKRWPGCYIPSLPEKKTIGSSENIFVESRRRSLQIFLQTLAHSLPIWNSQQMHIFLRNNSNDTQKMLSPLLKQSPDRILAKYTEAFNDFNTGDIMQDAAANISEFSSYLKDSKIFLEKLTEQTQKMYDIYNNNLQKKLAVLQFLLPDYEKNCLHYNDEKKNIDLLFMESERFEIKDAIESYKKVNEYPPILLVTEEIRREKRQIDAFEEAIKTKNETEVLKIKAAGKVKDLEIKQSKINAGKESLFSMITSKPKEVQLAQNTREIEAAKAEEAMCTKLCQIITNMIGTNEIYRFKQLRQKAYYKMLKSFATMEKELATAEGDIWLATQNHDWIGDNQQKKKVEEEEETQEQQPLKEVEQQQQPNYEQQPLKEVEQQQQPNYEEQPQYHEQIEEIKQEDI